MVAWKLTGKQRDASDQMRFSTRDAKVFRNATIILLSAAGNSSRTFGESFSETAMTTCEAFPDAAAFEELRLALTPQSDVR